MEAVKNDLCLGTDIARLFHGIMRIRCKTAIEVSNYWFKTLFSVTAQENYTY